MNVVTCVIIMKGGKNVFIRSYGYGFFRSYGQNFGPLVFYLFGPLDSVYEPSSVWFSRMVIIIWSSGFYLFGHRVSV